VYCEAGDVVLLERNPGSIRTGKRLLLALPAAVPETLALLLDLALLLVINCPCWARLAIMPTLSRGC
jgi:hypothetical protein